MTRRLFLPGLAAGLLTGACGGVRLPPLPMPAAMAPASLDEAVRWASASRPTDHRDIRFRWKLQDQFDASGGGDGRARLAPPDSVRLDVRGSLGIGRAAAFVAGDTAPWAVPEEDFERLVPNYPLFWAMLGVVPAPDAESTVRHFTDARVTAWQFALGQDTVEYLRESSPVPRLIAQVRQGARLLGRVETKFGPDGLPASSRLTVLQPPSRLELTFTQNAKAQPFATDIWARPIEPSPR